MFNFTFNSVVSKLSVGLLLIVLPGFILKAQVRQREARDSAQADANGYWYHQEYDQFETQFPKLKVVPPLSSGMDYETLISYIALDSLMRSTNRDFLYAKYVDNWNKTRQKNDTIVQLVKYLYKMIDYDPVRFNQYDYSLSSEYYSIKLVTLTGMIANLFSNIILNTAPQVVLSDLNSSDYILKVRVNSISVLPQTGYTDKSIIPDKYIYKVNATVLDTLKGRVFNQCNNNNQESLMNSITPSSSSICLNYGTGHYANDVVPFKVDPVLLNSDGYLTLKSGQDLIVSLSYENYLWDRNYDYLDLHLFRAIPIINNKVSDISHIWSKSTLLDYSEWKEVFIKTRDMLLNGGY